MSFKRRKFDAKSYNECDSTAYDLFVNNCKPFYVPKKHKEDFNIDVILQYGLVNGEVVKLPCKFGIELEMKRRWLGAKYPYPTIHFLPSKVQRYQTYPFPTYYMLVNGSHDYVAVTPFNKIEIANLVGMHVCGGYEKFIDAPLDYTRIIRVQDIGEFFRLIMHNETTRHLWIQ